MSLSYVSLAYSKLVLSFGTNNWSWLVDVEWLLQSEFSPRIELKRQVPCNVTIIYSVHFSFIFHPRCGLIRGQGRTKSNTPHFR